MIAVEIVGRMAFDELTLCHAQVQKASATFVPLTLEDRSGIYLSVPVAGVLDTLDHLVKQLSLTVVTMSKSIPRPCGREAHSCQREVLEPNKRDQILPLRTGTLN